MKCLEAGPTARVRLLRAALVPGMHLVEHGADEHRVLSDKRASCANIHRAFPIGGIHRSRSGSCKAKYGACRIACTLCGVFTRCCNVCSGPPFGITRPSSLGYPGSKTQMSHFRRCICEASLPSALPKVVRSFERNGCFVVKRNNSRSVVCPWPVSRRGGGEEIASLCGPAEAAHLLSSWRLIS